MILLREKITRTNYPTLDAEDNDNEWDEKTSSAQIF